MIRALQEMRIVGVQTSVPTALRVLRSAEWAGGDYDTGILQRTQEGAPAELLEIASLAAAVARYHGTERLSAATPAGQNGSLVPWVLAERAERLARRPR
jgi:acetyl/propionyl-CoA carboxylase alpha subunit